MKDNLKISYASVDIAKFIFAIGIVVLHCHTYAVLPGITSYLFEKLILRLAVPFFFVASGFFLGKKLENDNKKEIIISYSKRLFIPLLIFGFFNLILQFFIQYFNGDSINVICMDIMKHIAFYPYGALWYLYASIVGALLLYPFVKRNKINLALIIGVALYAFALICNNYYFVADIINIKGFVDSYLDIFISARNGIFVGFLFLGLGIKAYSLRDINKTAVTLSTAILFAVYCAEIILIRNMNHTDDGALYVTHILLLPSLFLLFSNYNLKISNKYSKIARNFSTGIYFQHKIYIACIELFTVLTGFYLNVIIETAIVLITSIVICILALRENSKIKKVLF